MNIEFNIEVIHLMMPFNLIREFTKFVFIVLQFMFINRVSSRQIEGHP
jgi:hypothetical protein